MTSCENRQLSRGAGNHHLFHFPSLPALALAPFCLLPASQSLFAGRKKWKACGGDRYYYCVFFFESLPNYFDIGANFMLVLCRQNVIGGNKLVKMAIAAVIRNGFWQENDRKFTDNLSRKLRVFRPFHSIFRESCLEGGNLLFCDSGIIKRNLWNFFFISVRRLEIDWCVGLIRAMYHTRALMHI